MRVLVTGAGGQLGTDMVAACRTAGDEVVAADRATLDITDRSAALAAITTLRPDAVINCGAWTAVDACEADPDRAWLNNALAVRWLREACDLAGSHLVQVSTDYVFDGTKSTPYVEWDSTNPQSVYGHSKRGGEVEAGPSATIVRTAWVVGEHGSNMVKTILRLAVERPALAFVDDQRGCPTLTADLAVMLRRLAVERRTGIHHVTNQGAMSWYDFARLVVAAAGHSPDIVSPISTADLQPPRPAARPANSILDNAVLRLQGLPLLRPIEEAVSGLVAAILSR
jgi:dTDP-4-dehydrorhamnose reductase